MNPHSLSHLFSLSYIFTMILRLMLNKAFVLSIHDFWVNPIFQLQLVVHLLSSPLEVVLCLDEFRFWFPISIEWRFPLFCYPTISMEFLLEFSIISWIFPRVYDVFYGAYWRVTCQFDPPWRISADPSNMDWNLWCRSNSFAWFSLSNMVEQGYQPIRS